MKHLWEVDHPYYANEGNYYSRDCHTEYESWQDFFEEEGESDLDMNLVYRWDWREGDDWGIPSDESRFLLFFIGQRKALARSVTITVTRADEPEILAYLRPRYEKLLAIWAPLST